MLDTKTLGENIRHVRKIKGITQEELAQKAGLSTMSIRRYENGERVVTEKALKQIADALEWPDLTDRSIWIDEYGTRHLGPKETRTTPLIAFDKEKILKAIENATNLDVESIYDEMESEPGYKALVQIDEALAKLNPDGQQEAVKRVEELTEIPRYQAQQALQPSLDSTKGKDTTPAPEGSERPQDGE